MPPHSIERIVQRERGKALVDILEEAWKNDWALRDLVHDLGVTEETVRDRLKHHGYERFVGIRPAK